MDSIDPEAFALKEKTEKDSQNAHDAYRKTGFGISAGIITLSSGLLYFGLNKNIPIPNANVFVLPIILSFLQQLTNYLAAHSEARSLSKASEMAIITAYPHLKLDIKPPALERYFLFQRQNRLYTVSDWFCIVASATFVGLCDAAVFSLGPLWIGWAIAIISVGSLIVICKPYFIESSEKRQFALKKANH